MERRSIILVIFLFLLIILGMFTFAYLKKTELPVEPTPPVVEEDSEEMYPDIVRFDAKHFYSDGVHTFVGEINMPTPCDLLDVQASDTTKDSTQIKLEFTVINNSDVCAQVITPARFRVDAEGLETAVVTATFLGRPVELNLIPPAPGETPDEFELFIKG